MPSALKLRADYSAADLRDLAKRARDNNQSRRLLSLAAVLDGMNRTDAARIGGMDRQTLRDWVHRFNQQGPDGLRYIHAGGVGPRLSSESLAQLAAIVEAGPDREKDGVVRWRRVDLKRVVKERFGGLGVKRVDVVITSGHVHDALLDDRRRLQGIFRAEAGAQVSHPRRRESLDVLRVDLRQGRIASVAKVPAHRSPFLA
jgi:transposase